MNTTTTRSIAKAALFETHADALNAVLVYRAALSSRERANRTIAIEWSGSQRGYLTFIEHASGSTTYLAH